jgi:glycosyltransferase involved in cell wall biosynthesis
MFYRVAGPKFEWILEEEQERRSPRGRWTGPNRQEVDRQGVAMPAPTVLLVNKFYHDVGPAGGVGRYLLQEEEDLTAAGWRVVPFAMKDADCRPSPFERFFVTARDYSLPRWTSTTLADARALIWNREAADKLAALLREVRPDVAHLHNIYHHLSPSILPVLARHRVPMVMTLHDLRLLCPAIHMLRHGRICERCRGGRFYEAVLGRCVKDSRAASLLAALETAHQHYRHLYRKYVSLFLCPSRFYREKFMAWGYPAEKLLHLPNFVDLEAWRPEPPAREAAYLYFGRISREKGLATLLEAQALWEREATEGGSSEEPFLLRIAGEGPFLEELGRRAAALRLQRVEILGPLTGAAVRHTLARSRFTVLPSEWYENAPMALLESLAAGRPVVSTRLGGIPELIEDGRDGVLCAPGDPRDLLAALRRAAALGPAAGERARRKAEAVASRPEHMARLREVLSRASRAHPVDDSRRSPA